jgi:DNA-directed RNA polymerase specialized sigma24 family protein
MIDSFWTKWRIKQLARGEALLAGKWLEDYARWLYGRAWYRCQGEQAQTQRLVEETFTAAAGRLKECAAGKSPMSEWLLSIYEQLAAGLPVSGPTLQSTPELRKAVGCFLISPVLETEAYWPELTRLGQQALAMLSCDEQCLLVCRYIRLERPASTAALYGRDVSTIQTLLYKASHSFRRILEALAGPEAREASGRGQMDSAILEANLEKVFRTIVPESPSLEFMAQLKGRVEAILAQSGSAGWSKNTKLCLGAGCAVLCAVILIVAWYGISGATANEQAIQTPRKNDVSVKKDVSAAVPPDSAQEVQLAVRLGTAQDVEGLLGILRKGTYPAQVAAAHYLAQFGDQSAINLLDQAAQKWYAENSAGPNPFIEAIAAIENRMRLQARQELLAKAQSLLTRPPATPETPPTQNETIVLQEPNTLIKQEAAKPQSPVLTEPNVLPQEPNDAEPLLVIYAEPNEPTFVEDVNEPVFEEDANLPEYEEFRSQ